MRYDRFAVAIVTGVVFMALIAILFMVNLYPTNVGSATPYVKGETPLEAPAHVEPSPAAPHSEPSPAEAHP